MDMESTVREVTGKAVSDCMKADWSNVDEWFSNAIHRAWKANDPEKGYALLRVREEVADHRFLTLNSFEDYVRFAENQRGASNFRRLQAWDAAFRCARVNGEWMLLLWHQPTGLGLLAKRQLQRSLTRRRPSLRSWIRFMDKHDLGSEGDDDFVLSALEVWWACGYSCEEYAAVLPAIRRRARGASRYEAAWDIVAKFVESNIGADALTTDALDLDGVVMALNKWKTPGRRSLQNILGLLHRLHEAEGGPYEKVAADELGTDGLIECVRASGHARVRQILIRQTLAPIRSLSTCHRLNDTP